MSDTPPAAVLAPTPDAGSDAPPEARASIPFEPPEALHGDFDPNPASEMDPALLWLITSRC